jgi:hypothetical protein
VASPQHQRDSFELLAREVFPHFTGQIAPRVEGVASMGRFGATGEKLAAAQEKARREYAAEKEARSA